MTNSFVLIDSDGEQGVISETVFDEPLKPTRKCRQITLFEYKQNDPKRDTGMKLVRKGLARSVLPGAPFKGIVLSAQGRSVLSSADAPLIASTGIGAVNCSWNRLDEISNIPGGNLGRHRKLPFLVAANPINYGKAFKLSTAEAIAGGLAVAGFLEDAYRVTEKFSWHDEFWKLNLNMVQAYAACGSSREVIQVQEMFMAKDEKQVVDYDDVGAEATQNELETDTPVLAKKEVTFSPTICEVRLFDKHEEPTAVGAEAVLVPTICEEQVEVPQFPNEAPKDQRNCLLIFKSLPIEIGIPKNATGNVLAKLKRKEYLEIWARFVAVDEHVKYVAELEAALCRKH